MPFFEPGLPELLRKALDSGRLRFTTDFAEVAEFGDVHFVCVGTPQQHGLATPPTCATSRPRVERAGAAPAPGRALVVGKSTVPVGTAARLAELVAAARPGRRDVELAWNPEFLREGYAVEDTCSPDRLVFGVALGAGRGTRCGPRSPRHRRPATPVVVTDLATAELVKVAANSFLATKISFINAMAEVCEATRRRRARSWPRRSAYDARIGGRFLHAGLGFGGGCLPKDIRAFMARAEELGVDQDALAFLREVDAINKRRRARTVDLAPRAGRRRLAGKRVCVLGAAFKPNTDDIRDSPALDVAATLQELGARGDRLRPGGDGQRPAGVSRAATTSIGAGGGPRRRRGAAAHRVGEFREIDPDELGGRGPAPHRRRARSPRRRPWRAAGWPYRALGRPA